MGIGEKGNIKKKRSQQTEPHLQVIDTRKHKSCPKIIYTIDIFYTFWRNNFREIMLMERITFIKLCIRFNLIAISLC